MRYCIVGGGILGLALARLVVRESTPDKVLPRISQHGGHVIQTSLSTEAEERLRHALGDDAAA